MNLSRLQGNHYFENIFKFSHDFICIASQDGYFKEVNQTVMQTLGYSYEELLNRPIESFIHSEDQPSAPLYPEQSPSLLNSESRYLTKTGEVVWVYWTSTLLENEQLVLGIGKNTTLKNQTLHNAAPAHTAADQQWLNKFESTVRKHNRNLDLNLNSICAELAICERQLFRRTKAILGVTPNQYVRKIRLQLAMDAIKTGKYRTIAEISHVAGFKTPSYFKRLFEANYNLELEHLL